MLDNLLASSAEMMEDDTEWSQSLCDLFPDLD